MIKALVNPGMVYAFFSDYYLGTLAYLSLTNVNPSNRGMTKILSTDVIISLGILDYARRMTQWVGGVNTRQMAAGTLTSVKEVEACLSF